MSRDLGIDGIGPAVLVGTGGSASVFAAKRTSDNERVAVKILKSSAASDKDRQNFENEQKLLAKLDEHPGIVPILGSGITGGGEPYFLMPLMTASVQDQLDEKKSFSWEQTAAVVTEVADAIAFAHKQGVLHRDLKPGNILIDHSSQPKVSDFGISRLTSATMNTSTTAVGTPGFVPPEQYKGQKASEQSDVYALGATAIAMINGIAPFTTGKDDTTVSVMYRALEEQAPDLTESGVPEDVALVIA